MSETSSAPHEAQIAFLLDYDSLWAIQLQPHHRDFETMRYLFVCYRALQRLGLPADVVSTEADLGGYKMVIVPTASLATERLATSLNAFAEAGGTVLLGVRSGCKTIDNRFTDRPLPGVFRDLVGASVSDWHSLPPGIGYGLRSSIPGLVGPATVWAEALHPAVSDPQHSETGAQALAEYSSGPFSSLAALTEHTVGDGRALYWGWFPDGSQAEALLGFLAAQAGVSPLATLPDGVIASQRGSHIILLNFTDQPQTATVQGRTVLVGPRNVEVVSNRAS
jgi:beta-galactosidase